MKWRKARREKGMAPRHRMVSLRIDFAEGKMNEIRRHEVIGHKVKKLFYTYKLLDDWTDCVTVYFVLDNGIVLTMPMPGHVWERSKLPWQRKRLKVEGKPIIRHRILGVYGEMEEDGPDSESGLIRLDDGRHFYANICAPRGTGGAGLHVLDPDGISEWELIDIWDLPLR